MVKIIISLRSVSQSNQQKSVFPQVFKWLSCGFQGLGAGTIIKNAYSCIHFRCPLEKCFYLWRCASPLICAMERLRASCTVMAESGALCAHTEMYPGCSHPPPAPQLTPSTLASGEQLLPDACQSENWFSVLTQCSVIIQTLDSYGYRFQGWALILPDVSWAAGSFQIFLTCREGTGTGRARCVSEVCSGKGFSGNLTSHMFSCSRGSCRRQVCNNSPRGLFLVAKCHDCAKQKYLKNQGFGFGDWLGNICIHLSI